jgi:hypothetical protein
MAKLTANGITFSDTSQLNSKRGIFSTGTSWIFYQQSAPSGWTKVTTHNNKALRVVSGNGGGSGGTNSFTSTMSSFNIGGTIYSTNPSGPHQLLTSQIASHTHPQPTGLDAVPQLFNPDGSFIGWNGGDVIRSAGWTRTTPAIGEFTGGDGHSHPVSVSGPVSPQSVSISVQYVDIIICTFDG